MKPAAEHFIPYEQIEPLLRPGMTGKELRLEIFRRLGLNPQRHKLITNGGGLLPLHLALKRGVYVRPWDYKNWINDGSDERVVPGEGDAPR